MEHVEREFVGKFDRTSDKRVAANVISTWVDNIDKFVAQN